MKLHDVIDDYLAHQHSIGRIFTSRRFLLRAFNRAVGREVEIQHVDPHRVLAFLGRPTTRYWHDKYYALARFYRYATSRGHASSVPLPRTIPKISSQFVPYIYTHDDVRRLLEATNSYRKIHIVLEPHTFRAILLLLYAAGLRISEALSLRMDDVDLFPLGNVLVFGVSWLLPQSKAARVFSAWQGWAPTAPNTITSIMRVGPGGGGSILMRCIGQSIGSNSELRNERRSSRPRRHRPPSQARRPGAHSISVAGTRRTDPARSASPLE